jgi:hypothetical protein
MLPILLLAALNLAAAPPQTIGTDRMSLARISGMHVSIEGLSADAITDGLSADQLQTDVELKLRLAGIKLGSKFDPYIYVNVAYTKTHTTQGYDIGYSGYVFVSFRQPADLVQNKGVRAIASTWDIGSLVFGPPGKGKEHVRDTVRDFVDKFINDYLAANRKP